MSQKRKLHQINFKKNQYIVGGIELTTLKDVRIAMKHKMGLMIIERK